MSKRIQPRITFENWYWYKSLNYQFQLNLPQNWVSETPLASFVALDILEDLLRIQANKKSAYNLVVLDL